MGYILGVGIRGALLNGVAHAQDFPNISEKHISFELECQRSLGRIDTYKSIKRPIRVKLQTMQDSIPQRGCLDIQEYFIRSTGNQKTVETHLQDYGKKIIADCLFMIFCTSKIFFKNQGLFFFWLREIFRQKKKYTERIHQFLNLQWMYLLIKWTSGIGNPPNAITEWSFRNRSMISVPCTSWLGLQLFDGLNGLALDAGYLCVEAQLGSLACCFSSTVNLG